MKTKWRRLLKIKAIIPSLLRGNYKSIINEDGKGVVVAKGRKNWNNPRSIGSKTLGAPFLSMQTIGEGQPVMPRASLIH